MNLHFGKRAGAIGISILMFSLSLLACDHNEQLPVSNSKTPTPVLTSEVPEEIKTEELKGEFMFWHFDINEGIKLARAFEAKHPGVKIDVQTNKEPYEHYSFPFGFYENYPDVCAAEIGYVKRLVNIPDALEDLSLPPYNAEELTGKMVPYTVDVGRSDDGKIKALTNSAIPGGIGYKRDIARKYLGTDDPDAISEMLSSTEKIIDTAKKLKERSDGKVKLVPGHNELMIIYLAGRSEGWIKEGRLNIDPKMLEYIDLQKQLRDMGQDGGLEAWTPSWQKAVASDSYFMFAIPTWGIPYIIEIYDTVNKDTGRWGIAKPTYPYFWGGTWYCITKKSTPEKKKLAWEFIKFICTDTELLESIANSPGAFINNTEMIEKLSKDAGFINKTINQNLYEVFKSELSKVNGKLVQRYDTSFENMFVDFVLSYLTGNMSKEEALNYFKESVKEDFKDIVVE
ncbi:MAG TPA: ABC transporter substrate-binding protein [Acetivibrio clariflavus]|nr:ABC transporter substrate-binding protein [Acetivibrio clariflavus]